MTDSDDPRIVMDEAALVRTARLLRWARRAGALERNPDVDALEDVLEAIRARDDKAFEATLKELSAADAADIAGLRGLDPDSAWALHWRLVEEHANELQEYRGAKARASVASAVAFRLGLVAALLQFALARLRHRARRGFAFFASGFGAVFDPFGTASPPPRRTPALTWRTLSDLTEIRIEDDP